MERKQHIYATLKEGGHIALLPSVGPSFSSSWLHVLK
jgi:hypothetical protein